MLVSSPSRAVRIEMSVSTMEPMSCRPEAGRQGLDKGESEQFYVATTRREAAGRPGRANLGSATPQAAFLGGRGVASLKESKEFELACNGGVGFRRRFEVRDE